MRTLFVMLSEAERDALVRFVEHQWLGTGAEDDRLLLGPALRRIREASLDVSTLRDAAKRDAARLPEAQRDAFLNGVIRVCNTLVLHSLPGLPTAREDAS
jgi:hypothetical protein